MKIKVPFSGQHFWNIVEEEDGRSTYWKYIETEEYKKSLKLTGYNCNDVYVKILIKFELHNCVYEVPILCEPNDVADTVTAFSKDEFSLSTDEIKDTLYDKLHRIIRKKRHKEEKLRELDEVED